MLSPPSQTPVVYKLDNAIQDLNHHPVDKHNHNLLSYPVMWFIQRKMRIQCINHSPLNRYGASKGCWVIQWSDLFNGYFKPPFEQLGSGVLTLRVLQGVNPVKDNVLSKRRELILSCFTLWCCGKQEVKCCLCNGYGPINLESIIENLTEDVRPHLNHRNQQHCTHLFYFIEA